MIKRPTTSALIAVGLITVGAVIRIARDAGWLPLPPNVAPISAMAILSGLALPRRYALVVPLTAMLLSDMVIGFYSLPVMIAVYAAFGVSNYLGRLLRNRMTARGAVMASLFASLIFFTISNGAVWAFQTMYQHTLIGLGQAYLAGIPFFRNTLVGDLIFTGVFVGGYTGAVVYLRQRVTTAITTSHG